MSALASLIPDGAVWGLVAIPLVSGAIGWGTNYLAFLMIFWPVWS